MTFNSNETLLPGGESSSADRNRLSQIEAKLTALQQTVTSVADTVSSLSSEVDTTTVKATSAQIGSETVTTSTVTNLTASNADITDADISSADIDTLNVAGTATADTVDATTINGTNAVISSVNTSSLTGVNGHLTGKLTVDDEVETDTLTATDSVSAGSVTTEALEVTGVSTIRGDVNFPEDGDEISGQYLAVKAKVVQANSLTTETPVDTNNLVGFDANGKLIPVDGSLDPSNLWKLKGDDAIEPKNDKVVSASAIEAANLTTDTPIKSLKHIAYDDNGKLVPSELKISNAPHNAIAETSAGLYAPQMLISEEAGQAIESKADGIYVQKLTAGDNIAISEAGEVSATDTTYTAGNNISISDDHVISCDISTMNYRGSVATYADLPASGQVVGDVWNVEDTATNYCWNGSAWTAIGSSVDVSGLMNKNGSNANIPTNTGTLTTSNELLVKDSDGKIKGESIADIKSDFFPVDTALSTTSENPVQNKVITQDLGIFVLNSSSTNITLNTTPGTGTKIRVYTTRQITGNTLYVNVNSTMHAVKVWKCGTLEAFPYHTINNVNVLMNAGTYLELYYSAGVWIVLGNPEVITYTSDTVSYRIKADGLISCYGKESSINTTVTLPIVYSSTNYEVFTQMTTNSNSAGNNGYFGTKVYIISNSSFSSWGNSQGNITQWRTIGY